MISRRTEIARDVNYSDTTSGASFGPAGQLATTSYDGRVRLYDASFRLVATAETIKGRRPHGIAFSPDGAILAIGFLDTAAVDLLDGRTLTLLFAPDTSGIDNGNLRSVGWATDGETLFAAGLYSAATGRLVVAWAEGGAGARRELLASQNAITALAAADDGGLLVGAADPYLALLDPVGRERWVRRPPQADFRGQERALSISSDGQTVDFGYEALGEVSARFDLAKLALTVDPPNDARTTTPRQDGLLVEGWRNTFTPTLNGRPLRLDSYEPSRSLAIHPEGKGFVLGAEWSLRAYNAEGEELWRNPVPAAVWAVNITSDGRLVVAAYGDGTIRWHRMDDGRELIAFLPLADRINWVAWTPEGFYAATPGAHGVLRWHVNRGWDAAAEAIPVPELAEMHRPEVLPLVLQEMDVIAALGLAEIDNIRRAVQLRTNSAVPPGTQLHVLAIGVSEYNEEHARHLRLEFADKDARDVASALFNTQGSLYARSMGRSCSTARPPVRAFSEPSTGRRGLCSRMTSQWSTSPVKAR
jgi:WD40 repeat protein